MGVQQPNGTVSYPVPGEGPKIGTVSADGTNFRDHEGKDYTWDGGTQGAYKRRSPPPMGPWHHYEFVESPTTRLKKYEQDPETLQYVEVLNTPFTHNG